MKYLNSCEIIQFKCKFTAVIQILRTLYKGMNGFSSTSSSFFDFCLYEMCETRRTTNDNNKAKNSYAFQPNNKQMPYSVHTLLSIHFS